MILLLDDDEAIHAQAGEALRGAGYEVRSCLRGAEALALAEGEEPELIVSDVLMPEMGGLAFREAYGARFPDRRTPFLFLSSLDDPDDIVRGLEVGADDYLAKPVSSPVLVAKVRAHLRRARRETTALFRGDLGKFPFAKVLQFCERQGFSGDVEVTAAGFTARFPFKAGVPLAEALEAPGDPLGRCLELTEGQFVLSAAPVDFSSLREAAAVPAARPSLPKEKPAGRLSGIRAGSRLFQIQTEFMTSPTCQAVTVVMLEGKTVLKRASPPAPTFELAAAERLIGEQHGQVEGEVREKLESLAAKQAPSPKNQADRLFEEGLERFLAKDYAGAVEVWEKARAIDPANKILEVNLGIARKKSAAAA